MSYQPPNQGYNQQNYQQPQQQQWGAPPQPQQQQQQYGNNVYGAPQPQFGQQLPPPPPQQNYGSYSVPAPPPQQYNHPPQNAYGAPPPAQQPQYGSTQNYGAPPVNNTNQYGGGYQQPPQPPAYGQQQTYQQQGYQAPQQQQQQQQWNAPIGAPPPNMQPAYPNSGPGGSTQILPGVYQPPPPSANPASLAPVYLPGQGPQPFAPTTPYGQPLPPHLVPKTYLGTQVHPSDNPLLPPNEQMKESAILDNYDPATLLPKDVEALRKATKGFGCDDRAITSILIHLPAIRIPPLTYAYRARYGEDVIHLLEKEMRGNIGYLMVNLMRGPVQGDVFFLNKAAIGLGTNEVLLTEIVIGRTPSSLDLLRAAYNRKTQKNFDSVVLDELSLKTKSCFQIALMGEWRDQPNVGKGLGEPSPGVGGFGGNGMVAQMVVNEQMVQADVEILSRTLLPGGGSPDQIAIANVIFARSPVHLNRLQVVYASHRRVPLTRHIKSNVSGHLQKAFLFALEGAKKDTTGVWRDTKMIFKTMEGLGTKDHLLITRLLRAHWNPGHLRAIKEAYAIKYKQPLATRVMKETSGTYRDALLQLVNQSPV